MQTDRRRTYVDVDGVVGVGGRDRRRHPLEIERRIAPRRGDGRFQRFPDPHVRAILDEPFEQYPEGTEGNEAEDRNGPEPAQELTAVGSGAVVRGDGGREPAGGGGRGHDGDDERDERPDRDFDAAGEKQRAGRDEAPDGDRRHAVGSGRPDDRDQRGRPDDGDDDTRHEGRDRGETEETDRQRRQPARGSDDDPFGDRRHAEPADQRPRDEQPGDPRETDRRPEQPPPDRPSPRYLRRVGGHRSVRRRVLPSRM